MAEPPNLWWYPLADGTMSARTLIDSMYATEGDIEHKPNALYWNLDNWIYSAKSAKRFNRIAPANGSVLTPSFVVSGVSPQMILGVYITTIIVQPCSVMTDWQIG